MKTRHLLISLLFLCSIAARATPQNIHNLMKMPPFERACILIKYCEQWHTRKDYPYIGYGHRIQPSDKLRYPITRQQGDSLLRTDLHRLMAIFSKYGKENALLLAVLAYNVGPSKIIGDKKHPKSRLLRKIESGDRHIAPDYLDFCRWKGKFVPSIQRRRMMEYLLLAY